MEASDAYIVSEGDDVPDTVDIVDVAALVFDVSCLSNNDFLVATLPGLVTRWDDSLC